jgi:hypothetical protein
LKPGAEKLLLAFSLVAIPGDPAVTDLGDGHREVTVKAEIRGMHSNILHTVGMGSCSTMEKKYRWRPGPVEITDQPVPREYWNIRKTDPAKALAMIGGPGHSTKKGEDGSWYICLKGEEVENPDIADVYNTVLKIATKRAVVDGALRATGASAMFTQDVEDATADEKSAPNPPEKAQPKPAPKPEAAKQEMPPIREDEPAEDDQPWKAYPEDSLVTDTVGAVSVKSGIKGEKKTPWTQVGLKLGDDWYSTFDIGFFDGDPKAYKGRVVTVAFEFDASGKYRNITALWWHSA